MAAMYCFKRTCRTAPTGRGRRLRVPGQPLPRHGLFSPKLLWCVGMPAVARQHGYYIALLTTREANNTARVPLCLLSGQREIFFFLNQRYSLCLFVCF